MNKNDKDTVVITKVFDPLVSNDDKDTPDRYKILDDVYTYQSGSKLSKLPKWAKILISCCLILVATGSVIGGAFAINAINQTTSQK